MFVCCVDHEIQQAIVPKFLFSTRGRGHAIGGEKEKGMFRGNAFAVITRMHFAAICHWVQMRVKEAIHNSEN
jgi:hypothetical protein